MGLSVAQRIAQLPPDELAEMLGTLSPDEVDALERDWLFHARPEQLPPPGGWLVWAILPGRGWGKTRVGAEFVLDRSLEFADLGLKHYVGLIARTSADCRDTMVEGESGLIVCAERRGIRIEYQPGIRRVTLPELNTTMTTYSAAEPDQTRGPQHSTAWADEPAAWQHKVDREGNTAWTNLTFGMRLHDPRIVATTTPKPIPLVVDWVKRGESGDPGIVLTRGSLLDNIANLAPVFVEQIMALYGGTRLGAQEIHGMLLDRVEGALWTPELIELDRVPAGADLPDLVQICVAVDPPGEKWGAECGIVVVGLGPGTDPWKRHVYVLEDGSMRGEAEEWAAQVVDCYQRWHANGVVGEVNNGGDMVRAVIHNVDRSIPFEKVRATDNKRRRAEPVAQVYAQHRAHHVGYFAMLESQQSTWVPTDAESPDHLDALVWGITHLMPEVNQAPAQSKSSASLQLPTGAGSFARRAG